MLPGKPRNLEKATNIKKPVTNPFFVLALGSFLTCIAPFQAFGAGQTFHDKPTVTPVPLPGGAGGIGFDNIAFSPALKRVLIPGGRTGNLYMIDPSSQEVETVPGFSTAGPYRGGHGKGITAVDEGDGFIFTTDRSARLLDVVDPQSKRIVVSAPLASRPDYVKYIPATHEVWVTQPGYDRIEIFSFPAGDPPALTHSAFIPVEGGPESIAFDSVRGLVYTNLWAGKTVAIDPQTHKITAQWTNGCHGSRCLAIDEEKGFLFTACSEGKATVLDLNHPGKVLSSLEAGAGADGIGYNPELAHLYLPGWKSATLSVLKVSDTGQLKLLREIKTEKYSHCAVSDDLGNVWICDPGNGRLLLYHDR